MNDSAPDTNQHIDEVRDRLRQVINDLMRRAEVHDCSKLAPPEKAMFDEFTPKLHDTPYGTEEYEKCREQMGTALAHHYAMNDHHPEHFDGGIRDMNLVQLIEMLADWKAATLRHSGGDLRKSIQQNMIRFGYTYEMRDLLMRTATYLGWL